MEIAEFGKLFSRFEREAFRLETLAKYSVDEEVQELAAFLAGEPCSTSMNSDWTSIVAEAKRRGKKMWRVHLLPQTLSPYLRFEIEWGYCFSAKAGEDIRFLEADSEMQQVDDFWLFDDSVAVYMKYDQSGRFIGVVEEKDPGRIRELILWKNDIAERSFSLSRLLAGIRRYKVPVASLLSTE